MNIPLQRNRRAVKALKELQLNHEHIHVLTIDNPSANLPYHNANHCISVALSSLKGAKHYGMNINAQRLLFLAGLYHDYDHSGGKLDDITNIDNAIKGLYFWCEKLENFSPSFIEDIAEAIKGTIWPQTLFGGTRTLYQNILSDADHMTWFEPDKEIFIEGLFKETGRPNDKKLTIEFLNKFGTKTSWAIEHRKEVNYPHFYI